MIEQGTDTYRRYPVAATRHHLVRRVPGMNTGLEVAVVVVPGLILGLIIGWRIHEAKVEVDIERGVLQKPNRYAPIGSPPPLCPYCDQSLERRRHTPDSWVCEDCPELRRVVGRPIQYSQDCDGQLLPRLDKVAAAKQRSGA